jgi:hypothetical protein
MNNDLFGGPGGYDRWFNTSCHPECPSSVRSIQSYCSTTILLFLFYIYVFVFIYNGLLTYSLFFCSVVLLSELFILYFFAAQSKGWQING